MSNWKRGLIALASLVALAGTAAMMCSASAVIVRLGLTPGLAGMTEPSTTYKPG